MQNTTADPGPLVAGWLSLVPMAGGWLLVLLVVGVADLSVALAPDWPLARTLVFVALSGAPLALSGWALWAAGATLVRRGPADWSAFTQWAAVPAVACIALVVWEFFAFSYPGW